MASSLVPLTSQTGQNPPAVVLVKTWANFSSASATGSVEEGESFEEREGLLPNGRFLDGAIPLGLLEESSLVFVVGDLFEEPKTSSDPKGTVRSAS